MSGVGSRCMYLKKRMEQAVLRCCYHYPILNKLLDKVMARESTVMRSLSHPCGITPRLLSPDSSCAIPIAILPLVPPGESDPFTRVDLRGVHILQFSTVTGSAVAFTEVEKEALAKAVSFRTLLKECLISATAPIATMIACCPTAVTRLLHNTCRELGITFVYIAPSAINSSGYCSFSCPLADVIVCERSAEQEFRKLGYGAESLCVVDSEKMMPNAVMDIVSQKISVGKVALPMERLMKGGRLVFPVIATTRVAKTATGEWDQKYIGPLFQAAERLEISTERDPVSYIGVDALLQWGVDYDYRRKNSSTDLLHCIQRELGIPRLILENAFVSSFDIGLKESAKGIIVDDRAPYFHAGEQSRLLEFLESDWEIAKEERARARRLIGRIVSNKITKYNHAPRDEITIEPAEKSKILIIDQVLGDASIIYGGGDADVFRRMLVAALGHAEYDIVLKFHPDATIGGRGANYTRSLINKACSLTGRNVADVHIVKGEINPYSLLECVEKVFVVTSGMGFEALLAGKEVTCFGKPFYSGWGVTVDRHPDAPRKRRRSLEEVFYAICVLFSIYYHPEQEKVVPLDDYLDYFIATLSGVTSPSSGC